VLLCSCRSLDGDGEVSRGALGASDHEHAHALVAEDFLCGAAAGSLLEPPETERKVCDVNTHTHTHTHTHAHRHKHTHTQRQTQTHTHTLKLKQASSSVHGDLSISWSLLTSENMKFNLKRAQTIVIIFYLIVNQ